MNTEIPQIWGAGSPNLWREAPFHHNLLLPTVGSEDGMGPELLWIYTGTGDDTEDQGLLRAKQVRRHLRRPQQKRDLEQKALCVVTDFTRTKTVLLQDVRGLVENVTEDA